MVTSVILGFWHCFVISLFMKSIHGVLAFVPCNTKSSFIPLRVTDSLNINLPDIGLCFIKGVRITPEISEILAKYDGTNSVRIISGKKSWNVNICRGVLAEDLAFFNGMSKYVDHTYNGSARIITPFQLTSYCTILNLVSVQLLAVRNCFAFTGENRGKTHAVFTGTFAKAKGKSIVTQPDLNFTEKPIAEQDVEYYVQDDTCTGLIAHSNHPEHKLSTAWGELKLLKSTAGLAVPFSTDISMPDRTGISSLIARCARLLDRATIDESAPPLNSIVASLDKDWREGIMSTIQGEWISHICACLELALRLNASIFCITKNGRYNGCVIGGGRYFVMSQGKVFTECTGEDFEKEREHLDLHQTILRRVMSLLDMPVETTEPKTLRALRSMINPNNFDGETQNKVSELLPQLDFGTVPEPINLSTMKEIFTLLSLDDPIVDSKRYMDTEAFWSTDKTTLVLSMFGRRAPVFSTGQVLRKLTQVARGTGSTTAPPYDPKPPSVLQVVNRPLVSAVETWKGLLSSGLAKGNWELENRGNILFRGAAKTELWAHMNDSLQKVLGKGEQVAPRDKRSLSEEGEVADDEGIVPPPKKQLASFSFF
jgi:hypothetical protein